MKYFAKIKYLGTNFHGFQVQPNARTVQGTLTSACKEAFSVPVKVTGCSRTDSGVHANEFCLTLEMDGVNVPPERLPVALMRYLPNDLSLFYAEETDDEFHPRYSVKSKEYLYRIKNTRILDPFDYGRVWFLPKNIDGNGIENMRSAAEYIVGKQDFACFMAEGSDIVDTVRTIHYLSVEKYGEYIDIRVCADGFLYNMVRIIVGTLVDVAEGRISADDVPLIIESKSRSRAGMTAPPEGLYLNKVNY